MNAVRLILPWWTGGSGEAGNGTVPVTLTFLRNGTVRGRGVTGTGTWPETAPPSLRGWWRRIRMPGRAPAASWRPRSRQLPCECRPGPDGYQAGRDHAQYRCGGPDGSGAPAVWPLDPGRFAAVRDLVRIAGACALAGLVDTVFEAIVAEARRKASSSEERWAGQSDKHRAVDITMRRDTARLHVFRALDAFGDAGNRSMFGALALTEAAAGLGDAVTDRRMIARRHGDEDALAAVDLAAAQHDLWLDLAGGSGALAATVAQAQLGRRVTARPA
jgi:hypothetical protein